MDALKSQFPEIAALLSTATEQQATAINLAVAKHAILKSGINNQYVFDAADSPDETTANKLKQISEDIERPYLKSLDSQDITEANKTLFLQARAVYSLAEAISKPALEHIGICVYEALHANETDSKEIKEIIQKLLQD